MHLIPEAADDLKAIAQERLTWLDKQLEGKDYICGDRFSLADIMFYCFINWGTEAGQPLNPENINVVKLLEKLGCTRKCLSLMDKEERIRAWLTTGAVFIIAVLWILSIWI